MKIEDVIAQVDVAFLDGTFCKDREVEGRNMKEIPHPFVRESMQRFSQLPETEKQKIRFIHLNHSNPLAKENSQETKELLQMGFRVAKEMETMEL